MKIKRKKQLNLPQLIEWALVNEIKHKTFQSNPNFDGVTYKLGFNKVGDLYFEEPLTPTLLFTVEVEEEITEDTKLPKSLAIFEHNGKLYSEMHENKNINDILKMDIKVKSSSTKTIHMVNDDGTHTLIWHEGKLVE
ncbi:hypothetical protein AB6F13_01425 [Staphylococcus saprophyticus]|uniref:hypothetical protein n=1 Tax=Staphylococcus saprophyticus TaxID=29385 RepID=UPI0034DD35A3